MEKNSKFIEDLKVRIAEGDFEALNLLYKYYYKRLKLYGNQFSPKLIGMSLDDTIQELFLWIAKNPQKLKEIKNLEVYLFSAFKKNIFQEIYKYENRQKVKNRFIESTNFESYASSPENKIIESERTSNNSILINNLLNTLSPKQKEVIYLRNYLNMSYNEIAEIMELSEQVVRNYGFRALQKLRTTYSNEKGRKEA